MRKISTILLITILFLVQSAITSKAAAAEKPIGSIVLTQNAEIYKISTQNKKTVVSKGKKGQEYYIYNVKSTRKDFHYIGNSLWISKSKGTYKSFIQQIIPSAKKIQVIQGQKLKLSYKISPANATSKLIFSSQNGWIASITKDGVITGHVVGSTNVIISSSDRGNARTVIPVEVVSPPPLLDVQKSTNNSYITISGKVDKKVNKMNIFITHDNKFFSDTFNIKNGQINIPVFLKLGPGKYEAIIDLYNGEDFISSDTVKGIINKDTTDYSYTYATDSVQSDHPDIINLANLITTGITDEYQKALAIHDWVARNIAYDTEAYFNNKNNPQDALSVLKNRRGVCQGYSALTAALFRASGIKAKLVYGIALGYGMQGITWADIDKTQSNHAWNEVFINNRWIIIDTTWDAGGITYDRSFVFSYRTRYFDPTPELFSIDHYKTEDVDYY